MKISITYISGDRFFGKAYIKCFSFIKNIEIALAEQSDLGKLSEYIFVVFVDKPSEYSKLVLFSKKHIEIQVGRDLEHDYRPMAKNDNNSKIKQEIRLRIKDAFALIISQSDAKNRVEKIVEDWYAS
ncbi:hypothetical protein [Undibacterium pigrum]|uniref:hypothetical protein n=1 Tax=Undibacterium pigrum TaxID=401470 RepID=UPI0011B77B11|nr:hypothetical protein [Undibacterium pigrum]